MRRFLVSLALLVLLTGGGRTAWARTESQGFSRSTQSYNLGQHAEYEVFYNNSGSALTSGTVVVFDRTGTGVTSTIPKDASRNSVDVNTPVNIGTYVTTTTSANSANVAGIVDDDSCAAASYCVVQIWGPRVARCADSSGTVTAGTAAGTSTVAGQVANGNGVGFFLTGTLNGNNKADNSACWVELAPRAND